MQILLACYCVRAANFAISQIKRIKNSLAINNHCLGMSKDNIFKLMKNARFEWSINVHTLNNLITAIKNHSKFICGHYCTINGSLMKLSHIIRLFSPANTPFSSHHSPSSCSAHHPTKHKPIIAFNHRRFPKKFINRY